MKKGLIAAERDRPSLRQARRDRITRRQPRMRQEPHRLVVIDGKEDQKTIRWIVFPTNVVKTNLTRLRGRAPVGELLYGTAPFGKWGTQTFIAGLTQDALIAPWVIKGAMNGPAFDTYVETQPAPALDPGTVIRRENDPPDRFLTLFIPRQSVQSQKPTRGKGLAKARLLVPVSARIQPRAELAPV